MIKKFSINCSKTLSSIYFVPVLSPSFKSSMELVNFEDKIDSNSVEKKLLSLEFWATTGND